MKTKYKVSWSEEKKRYEFVAENTATYLTLTALTTEHLYTVQSLQKLIDNE